MTVVNITIDGQKIEAQAGQTVYQAATTAGINIPVLCHHPALPPEGACRVCVVEIEKQRGLQPSCTFPITEGMVVQTESERVTAARKFVLELLFSERIHYCMYCPLSGSDTGSQCELQRLAYRYGLASWKFPPNTAKRWPVDASRKYFVMDHSRCILCRRCIRACDQIVANHTLGLRDRGARTMVIADADVPFGESSCVSCGTCLQVCPTGALIDRRSAYMGFAGDLQRTASTCMACPVGCGIEAVARSGTLLKVDGDWNAANGGLLCVTGRFEVVEPQPKRVTAPMVRQGGAWSQVSWDEAMAAVASRLRAAGSVAGLASPRATNEELAAFRSFCEGTLGSSEVGLIYGEMPPVLNPAATLQDLAQADCILLVGVQPLEGHKVAGYITRRSAENGALLIIASDTPTALEPYARKVVALAELGQAEHDLRAAERPVVVYGSELPAEVCSALRALPSKVRYLPLYQGANTAGAAKAGLKARPVQGNALWVYAADEAMDGHTPTAAAFTVVQAAYMAPWAEIADVILPAQVWSEKDGHLVNMEGRELPVVASTPSPAGVRSDLATFAMLADGLRH